MAIPRRAWIDAAIARALVGIAALVAVASSGCAGTPPPRPQPPFAASLPDWGARTWRLDAEKSSFFVEVPSSGVLSFLAHDHRLVVHRWAGEIAFEPEHPERTRAEIELATESLRDETPAIGEGSRRNLDEEILGEGIADAARHPRARFALERLEAIRLPGDPSSPRSLTARVRGVLDLHGARRPVEGAAAASWSDVELRVVGWVAVPLSAFGIERHRKLLGAIGNRDTVIAHFELTARRPR